MILTVTQTYVIEGAPVSGKNHTQIAFNPKTGRRYVRIGKVAQAWQGDAIRQLCEQRLKDHLPPLHGPLYVDYVAYQPWDSCDIDNIESALFDALKKAKVIEDDKFIVDHRGRKVVDKARPRIEVTITPISP